MTSDEFGKKLREHRLTPTSACDLIFIRTKAVIKPKNIDKALRDYGELSETYTAIFRLLFKMLEEQDLYGAKV